MTFSLSVVNNARALLGLSPLTEFDSSADKSARVKKQLRDRLGRWIEMGGGVRWRLKGDSPFSTSGGWVHGTVSGWEMAGGPKGNGAVHVDGDDGQKYTFAPDDLEAVKATLKMPAQGYDWTVNETDPEWDVEITNKIPDVVPSSERTLLTDLKEGDYLLGIDKLVNGTDGDTSGKIFRIEQKDPGYDVGQATTITLRDMQDGSVSYDTGDEGSSFWKANDYITVEKTESKATLDKPTNDVEINVGDKVVYPKKGSGLVKGVVTSVPPNGGNWYKVLRGGNITDNVHKDNIQKPKNAPNSNEKAGPDDSTQQPSAQLPGSQEGEETSPNDSGPNDVEEGGHNDHSPQEGVTDEEYTALVGYTGLSPAKDNSYVAVNNALRIGDTHPSVKHLDSLMEKSPDVDEGTILYRVVPNSNTLLPGVIAPGSIIKDPAYLSTSKIDAIHKPGDNSNTAYFKIKVPPGVKGIYVPDHGLEVSGEDMPPEKEMLLPRGTELRVLSEYKGAGGKRVLDVEVVTAANKDEAWSKADEPAAEKIAVQAPAPVSAPEPVASLPDAKPDDTPKVKTTDQYGLYPEPYVPSGRANDDQSAEYTDDPEELLDIFGSDKLQSVFDDAVEVGDKTALLTFSDDDDFPDEIDLRAVRDALIYDGRIDDVQKVQTPIEDDDAPLPGTPVATMPSEFVTNAPNDLTPDELKAIEGYVDTDYVQINYALRTGDEDFMEDELDDSDGIVADAVVRLDAVMNRSSITQDTVLHRGLRAEGVNIKDFKPGEVITDLGYMSVSKNSDVVSEFHEDNGIHIKMKVRKGNRAIDVAAHGDWSNFEKEVILPRGTQMQITNVTQTTDHLWTVDADVLLDEGDDDGDLLPVATTNPASTTPANTSDLHAFDDKFKMLKDRYSSNEDDEIVNSIDAIHDDYIGENVNAIEAAAALDDLNEDLYDSDVADLADKLRATVPSTGKLDADESPATAPANGFEILADSGDNGDGYHSAGLWGKYGAAGVMMRHVDEKGTERFLLVQRGPLVSSNKGMWQLPGGALNSKENPYQGTARETNEELGATPEYLAGLTPKGEVPFVHKSGWTYTNIAADAPNLFEPDVDGTETSGALWVTRDDLDEMRSSGDLVPAFESNLDNILAQFDNNDSTPEEPKTINDVEAAADSDLIEPADSALDSGLELGPGERIDTSDWVKVGGQGGSNVGGTYRAPNGDEYYVKLAQTPSHAHNEVAATRFYRAAGIDIPEVNLADWPGNPSEVAVASKIVDGATPDLQSHLDDQDYIDKMREGFAVDAWLANWDVAGLVFDNVVTDSSGNPVRIDTGGSLSWRAQGAPKAHLFGTTVGELDTLRDPYMNPQSSKIFGGITNDQLEASATRVLQMTDEKIDSIVDSVGFDSDEAEDLRSKLKARRIDLLTKVGLPTVYTPADEPDVADQPGAPSTPEQISEPQWGDLEDWEKELLSGTLADPSTTTEPEAPAPPKLSPTVPISKSATETLDAIAQKKSTEGLSADGVTKIAIGQKVTTKSGEEGEVVGLDPNPNYFKVKMLSGKQAGKTLARSTKTLTVVSASDDTPPDVPDVPDEDTPWTHNMKFGEVTKGDKILFVDASGNTATGTAVSVSVSPGGDAYFGVNDDNGSTYVVTDDQIISANKPVAESTNGSIIDPSFAPSNFLVLGDGTAISLQDTITFYPENEYGATIESIGTIEAIAFDPNLVIHSIQVQDHKTGKNHVFDEKELYTSKVMSKYKEDGIAAGNYTYKKDGKDWTAKVYPDGSTFIEPAGELNSPYAVALSSTETLKLFATNGSIEYMADPTPTGPVKYDKHGKPYQAGSSISVLSAKHHGITSGTIVTITANSPFVTVSDSSGYTWNTHEDNIEAPDASPSITPIAPSLINPPASSPTIPAPTGPQFTLKNGKSAWIGTVVTDAKGHSGVIYSSDPSPNYVKVKMTSGPQVGKVLGRSKKTLTPTAGVGYNGAIPGNISTSPSLAPETPKVTSVPVNVPNVEPQPLPGHNPDLIGTPPPQAPVQPELEILAKYVNDEWLNSVKAHYDTKGKGKPLTSSNLWPRVTKVISNGSIPDLDHLKLRDYVTQQQYDDAVEQINKAKSVNAVALADHANAEAKWKLDLAEWAKANPSSDTFDLATFQLRGMDASVAPFKTLHDGRDWAEQAYPLQTKDFYTTPERNAISEFVGDSTPMNRELWDLGPASKISIASIGNSYLETSITNLRSAIDRTPRLPEDVIVWRGTGVDSFVGSDGVRIDPGYTLMEDMKLDEKLIGTVQSNWGFMSTAMGNEPTGPGKGQVVWMKIRLSKGMRGMSLAHNNLGLGNETEFVVGDGNHYYVHSAMFKNYKWYLDVEMVPEGWTPNTIPTGEGSGAQAIQPGDINPDGTPTIDSVTGLPPSDEAPGNVGPIVSSISSALTRMLAYAAEDA